MKNKLALLLILVMILAVSLACIGTGGGAGGSDSGIDGTLPPGISATSTSAAQEFHIQLTLIANMDATPVP